MVHTITVRPLIILTLAAAALAVASPNAQRALRERHVFVGVTAGDDVPVRDLKADEFTVREDGVAREVLRATPAPPPSHLALLVDDSEAAQPLIADLRQALTTFVRRMSADAKGVQVALTTFGERPTRQVDYTPSAATIEKAVGRLFHRTGSGAYLLEAIQEVCRDLKKKEAPRPVIVAFVAERGPEFSNIVHQNVADALKDAGASLWTVVLQEGPQALGPSEQRERAIVLGDVTRDSGGANKVVLTKQALESAFASRALILTSRYDVAYGRPDALIPPAKLEVDVKRRDVHVMAPRWAAR